MAEYCHPYCAEKGTLWNNFWNAANPIKQCPKPISIVRAKSETDILTALDVAHSQGFKVSVRSSGHHCAALSLCQNGLVIDVSALIDLKIVPEKQVAHVQPGVRTGQLYQKLAKHKLHFPAGHISSVGCSGFLLHGGSGFNTRALGFACDNALSFRVAVPAGKDANTQQSHIVTASPTENPDLYWACRGGASFVGVVTSMCIRLVSSTEVIPTVFASVPLSELKHAWSIWKTAVDTSPATLQPMMVLNTDEKGDKCAAIAFYDFSVAEADQIGSQHAVNACLQSLQKVAHCKIDFQASELPYLDALSTLNATGDFPNQCVYNSSAFVAWKKADSDFIDVVMRHFTRVSSPKTAIVMAPTPWVASASPGAFGDRSNCLWYEVLTAWERSPEGPEKDGDALHVAWADDVFNDLRPWMDVCYMNNCMCLSEVRAGTKGATSVKKKDCFFEKDWQRLKHIKDMWDPKGILASMD